MNTARKYWEWTHRGYGYQVLEERDGKLRLWYRPAEGKPWEIGHSVEPGDMPAPAAVQIIRKFIFGDISVEDYRKAFKAA